MRTILSSLLVFAMATVVNADPKEKVKDKETADKVFTFMEKLEDNDDVQKVYGNFDISDDVMSGIQGS